MSRSTPGPARARLLAGVALVCILNGCAAASVERHGFTIRLEPSTVELHVTERADVTVLVTRAGGFAAPVTVRLAGGAGVSAEPVEIAGVTGVLVLAADEGATIGTSFLTVTAEAGGPARTETLVVRVRGLVARATSVLRLGDDPHLQVSQGAGTVMLRVEGTNLDRATSVGVGDLPVQAVETAPSRLVLAVEVPHGAEPGPKDLVLGAQGGDTSAAALMVTPVTASPGGDDAAGAGTPERPYRTLTRALGFSRAGDTVLLLAGEYGEDEQWPVFSEGSTAPNVPAGVQVVGEAADLVTLLGANAGLAALVFAASGGAADLTVSGFQAGVVVLGGTVDLARVTATDNALGLWADGGSARSRDGRFDANQQGVRVAGTATLVLDGGSVSGNREWGAEVTDDGSLSGPGLTVAGNHWTGVVASGSSDVVLADAWVTGNYILGLHASEGASVDLVRSVVADNTSGLVFEGSRLRLREVMVTDNAWSGLAINGTPEAVDLGTFTEPGLNSLSGNGGAAADVENLRDHRAERPAVEVPIVITISATSLEGVVPQPDIVVGPYRDPELGLTIDNRNNVIQFH